MSVYFETYQTVIQSTSMGDFFLGQFLAVKWPKTLDLSSRRLDK